MPLSIFKKKKDIPDGLWMKCPGCENLLYRRDVEDRLMVCPECDYHFTLTARERLKMLLDEGSFEETDANIAPCDPLHFVDSKPYTQRLEQYQKKTGLKDAIVTGTGSVQGKPVVIGVMDSRFIMASMGSVVGEKVTRAFERGIELKRPVVLVCASGGARMQEGVISLMQMAKTSAAVAKFQDAGGFYLTILTNPTTAGVMASFASLGDIIIAEPRALIGFTGPRVIKQTIRAELPENFQTSEFLLEHGFIDRVVHRSRLREEVGMILDYCS